jgi:hypothetical protein
MALSGASHRKQIPSSHVTFEGKRNSDIRFSAIYLKPAD